MELDYEGLFTALNQAGIRYLLTGGVAVNFHGLPRMTFDVDLIVLFEKENLEKLTTLLTGLGYKPRLPVPASGLADEAVRETWRREKGLLAYTFLHPSQPMAEVDVMLDAPAPFEELMSRRVDMPFGHTTVPLISRFDLIATKEGSPRQQDICDVEALRGLGGGFVSEEKRLKGFFHQPDPDMVKEYGTWPLERRAAWLFAGLKMRKLLPKEVRELQDQFRRGRGSCEAQVPLAGPDANDPPKIG